jgi:hypothetical protein
VENEVQIEEVETIPEPAPAEKSASNLPLIITLLALVIWFGFQTLQLARERSNLILVKANQETALQESQKVQMQFQGILAKLSELASQGHAGAKLIVDQLQRQGLSFKAEAKPAIKQELKTETKSETKPEAKSIK